MTKKWTHPLINTFFNVATKKFTMLLNRREGENTLNLKLFEERKKKRHANSLKSKNDDSDVSTWTCEHCKSFSKSHDAIQKGNNQESTHRCVDC